jgi:hypothetical protein
VTWRTWLAWVLVSALVPVLSTVAATAVGKQISRNATHPALIGEGLLALAVLAILTPPLLQGLVLKRILPKLSVAAWLLAILVSAVLWLVLLIQDYGGHTKTLVEAGLRTPSQLQSAALVQRLAGTLTTTHILDLPWGSFLLWTIAISALTSFVPAWVLGRASGLRRATLFFFAAAIAAQFVSVIVEQLYNMTVDDRALHDWGLNSLSWLQRFHVLALRAGVGAVWGATAAIFVMLMTRRLEDAGAPRAAVHRSGGLALVLVAPLLIAVLTPFAAYLVGPRGIVAGAPELRQAVSLAPSRDSSQGETILSYSHDVAIAVAPRSVAELAPDGQSAIVRAADHTLMQVDLATGHAVRQLAGALAPLERYSVVWSPDGRYLALRSEGAEVPIPNTHYTGHQSRVRLYALPDLRFVGEFSNREGTCFESYARQPMLFTKDGKSLYLVCGSSTAPKADDPSAINLDVPAMQVHDIRRYGEGAEGGQIRGLEGIGDSVWAWQFPDDGKPLRIRDLTAGRDIVTVPMPMALIGELTWQTGLVDEKNIRLIFCGAPPDAPSDAGPASWICRTLTFDMQTGALIGRVDAHDDRIPSPSRPRSTLSGHGLRIESFWRDDSKTGELVVRDEATGHERQRIVSIAQRPLQMSADGVWLMTVAIYGGGLRLYRIPDRAR